MFTEQLPYFHDAASCLGFIAYDEQVETKRPVVLVASAWRGQDDFAREKAVELAQLGYVGFAVDIYGDGKCVNNDQALETMLPFWLDRKLLQGRILAAFDFIKKHPRVDPNHIGAIGFCFGGLAVYELLSSGADVKGVVTFHGIFDHEREGYKAQTVPISSDVKGALLVLHGYGDPMVSDEDLKRVQKEMSQAGIDWQIHIYGQAMHAFTNPFADNLEGGILYNEKSAKRAWRSMEDFFAQVFSSENLQ